MTLGSCLHCSAIHILTRLGSDSAALAPILEYRGSPEVLTDVILRQLRFWQKHSKSCLLLILWRFSVLGFTLSVQREMRGVIHDHPWRHSCFCLATVAVLVTNQKCHFCVKNLICRPERFTCLQLDQCKDFYFWLTSLLHLPNSFEKAIADGQVDFLYI